MLNQIEEKNQKSIQSACKCICDDFHLSSSHSFSYPIPLTEINSFKTQQQNRLGHKFFAAKFNDLVMNILYHKKNKRIF